MGQIWSWLSVISPSHPEEQPSIPPLSQGSLAVRNIAVEGGGVANDGDGGVSLYGSCLHTCVFKPTYMYSHMHPQTYTQAHAHTHHAPAGSEAPSTLLNISFRREMASMNKFCMLVKEGGRVGRAAVSLSHEFTAEDSACGEGRRNREHQTPPPLTPTPT